MSRSFFESIGTSGIIPAISWKHTLEDKPRLSSDALSSICILFLHLLSELCGVLAG